MGEGELERLSLPDCADETLGVGLDRCEGEVPPCLCFDVLAEADVQACARDRRHSHRLSVRQSPQYRLASQLCK
jgi:hypothetical protein